MTQPRRGNNSLGAIVINHFVSTNHKRPLKEAFYDWYLRLNENEVRPKCREHFGAPEQSDGGREPEAQDELSH